MATLTEIADQVWTRVPRTVDGNIPAVSNGSYLDNILYGVWTYSTRTTTGSVIVTGTVAETVSLIDTQAQVAKMVVAI